MSIAHSDSRITAAALRVHWPERMRVLYVTNEQRTGEWLAEAFAADSASEVALEETFGAPAALARLQDEIFDVVLVSHDPDQFDALEFVEGLRAGGSEEPMIVLGHENEQDMLALCYEVGADGYVCVEASTTRNLIWTAARAIQHHQLIRESRRIVLADRQRLLHEHQETDRLLEQQRSLVEHLDSQRDDERHPARQPPDDLPEPLVGHYRQMLRTYVIMGSGDLAEEMKGLAVRLVDEGVDARQAMQLHLYVLEELVRGLGNRSARHVLSRGDRLALEVMAYLAEGYRERLLQTLNPPRQRWLPGVDVVATCTPER
jgi:DNA-binding NarL/FixJ family response regulator